LSLPTEREELTRLAERLQGHAGYVAQAQRELLAIGRSGFGDALLEVSPIGRARPLRDLLYQTYVAWADHRKYRVHTVREPMTDDEPVMIAVLPVRSAMITPFAGSGLPGQELQFPGSVVDR